MRNSFVLVLTLVLLVSCSGKPGAPGGSERPVSSSGELSFTLSFDPAPPKQGSETLTITLTDASGNPVKGATVTIDTKMPDMQMPGPSFHLQDNGDGTYSGVANLAYQTKWVFTAQADRQGKRGSAEFLESVK